MYLTTSGMTSAIADAIRELGADYDEMEIRLVRIKFLCEIAS